MFADGLLRLRFCSEVAGDGPDDDGDGAAGLNADVLPLLLLLASTKFPLLRDFCATDHCDVAGLAEPLFPPFIK